MWIPGFLRLVCGVAGGVLIRPLRATDVGPKLRPSERSLEASGLSVPVQFRGCLSTWPLQRVHNMAAIVSISSGVADWPVAVWSGSLRAML